MISSTAGPVAVGPKPRVPPVTGQRVGAEPSRKTLPANDPVEQSLLAQTRCDNEFRTGEKVVTNILSKRADVHNGQIRETARKVQEQKNEPTEESATAQVVVPTAPPTASQHDANHTMASRHANQAQDDESYESWVLQQFLDHGLDENALWIGHKAFKNLLLTKRPEVAKARMSKTVNVLMRPGHQFSLQIKGQWRRKSERSTASEALATSPATSPAESFESAYEDICSSPEQHSNDEKSRLEAEGGVLLYDSGCDTSMDQLIITHTQYDEKYGFMREIEAEIRHAPLVSANLITNKSKQLLPQYGLIGSVEKEKFFLNTNVPFSAFICGVQGSGKSHTTACILENVLIASAQLGRLQRPLSALVFSYGHFGGDGSGFSISEAAFLATPHPTFPNHPRVKRVNVFVSPSNYVRISRLYSRVPNVDITSFKLKPDNLDIDIMLTLMNVSESDDQPLYMAAVTQLLREMATQDGPFNYKEFKDRLKECRFNPVQENMLSLRLGLLESFLDLDDSCPELQFNEGEVTIMDMSCPFVDANTACILFRIGLQRYLQSKAAGKMVVLDEAHKYMLPNPGAKALNEALLTTIRLQRHYGARVLVSTQEPTLLTDLIALCSITIIHRFSSPEWFAAIKRHIHIKSDKDHETVGTIEGLRTGTALVYSPSAVLGKDKQDRLIKGTGQLMKLDVRKRVTSDGGMSVLAV